MPASRKNGGVEARDEGDEQGREADLRCPCGDGLQSSPSRHGGLDDVDEG